MTNVLKTIVCVCVCVQRCVTTEVNGMHRGTYVSIDSTHTHTHTHTHTQTQHLQSKLPTCIACV